MKTRWLMSASALFMGALGVAASFLPQEVLAYAGAPPGAPVVLLLQVLGALYLGFAMLNWMARGSLMGGIYGRPLAMGNFLHFFMVALLLLKALAAGPATSGIVIGALAYTVFGLWFGLVLFRNPSSSSPARRALGHARVRPVHGGWAPDDDRERALMVDRLDDSIGSPSSAVPLAAAFWLRLSIVAALLAAGGSVVGLVVPGIYAPLTPVFLPQALAQDVANLLLVAPLWLVLATLARRGSLRAYLLWLGVLAFTVYNYVIYTFSIPFGPLFLPWVAVLGLSLYSLIGGLAALDHTAVAAAFASRRAVVVAAWSLMVMAILFGLLWLSEDVPALRAGLRPQSLVDMALPTNPVHILDLAFFLPAVLMVGWQLLGRRPMAHTLAPPLIAFLVLTGIPILLTPVVQAARGAVADWGVALPIGSLTVALTTLLAWLLATVREDARAGGDAADGARARS
jgi:hypothetical protein